MKRYKVTQQQVITYLWYVEAEDRGAAEDAALEAGMPDDAVQIGFTTDHEVTEEAGA